MKYMVICGGESGWRYHIEEEGDSQKSRQTLLFIADGEGKAQGVSIERGLYVHDVIGRMIVIQEVEMVKSEVEDVIQEKITRKRSPAFGIIGCQCVKMQ